MSDLRFHYPHPTAAEMFLVMTRSLYPTAPEARAEACVVDVPALLWDRPLVPELAIGLGGRLHAGDEQARAASPGSSAP